MRFKNLILKAFGPFDQKEIELSDSGLQIIVGDNGAGKSTTMRALRGLLFGIPESSDGWSPASNGKMEISGTLTRGEKELEIHRRRTKNFNADIYDKGSKKLDPSMLAPFTGSISASAFSTLFVIDALEIEDGGKALLSGDAGAALMAATSGTNAIPSVIESLKGESEAIFKPRGSNPKINEKISTIRDLKSESRSSAISANEWKQRIREQKDAESAFEAVKEQLEEIETKRNRARRVRGVVRSVGALRQFKIDLEEVKDAPILGDDATERRRDAQKSKTEAEATINNTHSKIETKKAELEAAAFDQSLVDLGPILDQLNDSRAVSQKAVSESLPKRNANYDEAASRALASLRKVHPSESDISKIDQFIPTTALKTEIQSLIAAHNTLTTLAQTSADDLEMEANAVKDLELDAKSSKPSVDTKRLAATIEGVLKEGRLEEDLRAAETGYKTATEKATRLATALSFVGDEPKNVVALPLPGNGEIREHEEAIASATESVREAERKVDESRQKIKGWKADLAQLEAASDVPTLADRDSAREERESIWTRIRALWVDGGSLEESETPQGLAESLEKATSNADHVSDRITSDLEQFANKQRLLSDIDQEEAAEVLALKELEAAETEQASAEAAWRAVWQPAEITPGSPNAMREWIASHAEMVSAWEDAVAAEIEVARLQDAINSQKDSLGEALAETNLPKVGPKETLEQAVKRAQSSLEEIRGEAEAQRQTAKDLKSAKARLAGAEAACAAAAADLVEWQSKWAKPLEAISLDPSLSPDAVQAVLNDLDEADKARVKAEEAEDRRTKILKDRDALGEYVKKHAVTAGIDGDLSDDPITAASQLATRITQAVASSNAADQLTSSLAELEEARSEAQLKLDAAEAELAALTKAAKVESVDELPEAETRSANRTRLEGEIKRVEAEILDGQQKSLEELIAEAEGADADSLEAETEQLNREFKDKEGERDEALERVVEAKRATAAGDSTSIAAEAASQIRSEAAEGAALVEQYARLKIAEVVLSRAVKANLEASQGPLVSRAGELFAELTDHKFNGLIVDWDGQEPSLNATQPDSEVPSERLSDGERDSLYLALRLAAIEQTTNESEAMPLLLDDVLINLDNDRTTAAIRVLAKVAESTQVLLFSHHPHVADLAKDCLAEGDFSILELAA